jgi:hypothetical protein
MAAFWQINAVVSDVGVRRRAKSVAGPARKQPGSLAADREGVVPASAVSMALFPTCIRCLPNSTYAWPPTPTPVSRTYARQAHNAFDQT